MRRPTRTALIVLVLSLGAGACTSSASRPAASPGSSTGGSSSAPAGPAVSIHAAAFHLPSPLQREVVVRTTAGLVLAGGLTSADVSLRTVTQMDPVTGALTPLGSLAVPVHDAAGAILGGRLLVFGGGGATSLDTVQSFDLSTGASSVIGHLPGARSDLAAAELDGTVYLFGGYDDTSPRREIYATTDGVTFHRAGELPIGLRYPGVAVVGSVIIVAGGQTAAGASPAVLAFDPAAGTVKKIGALPAAIGHAAVFTLGGSIYVLGGLTAGGVAVRTVSRIDPATGAVTPLPPLRRPISDAGVGLRDNGALIIGGALGSDVATTVATILVATLRP